VSLDGNGGFMSTQKAASYYEEIQRTFTCPACLITGQRYDSGEEQQRCKTCGSFHNSDVLILDGWTI
jgi:hypothetical protein